jgi:hypothetical protein
MKSARFGRKVIRRIVKRLFATMTLYSCRWATESRAAFKEELVDQIELDSLRALQAYIAKFGDKFLFRGQTNNYSLPDGSPNLTSSFARKGCIPPLMLKWFFYAEELLRRGGLDLNRPDLLNLTQGLLQHYGWRSFFVDLSSDAAVAAWFASHAFQACTEVYLCENTREQPVFLKFLGASYKPSDGIGHLYVLDKEMLTKSGHTLVSLEHELATTCPSRFQTQKAWLAGIFHDQRRLDPRSIAAHICAPSPVFKQLAGTRGFNKTNDIFPPPSEDKLLQNLLDLPWLLIDVPNPPFPFYRRSLEIPEYQVAVPKHLPPTAALYSPFWLSDAIVSDPNEIWIRAPEELFYYNTETDRPIPRLSGYLRESGIVNIETKGLLCYPAYTRTVSYAKGISIRKVHDNLFDVCGVEIDYKSDQFVGAGASEGYRYELVDDTLVRRRSPTDCSCGDPARHVLHLCTVAALDQQLSTATAKREGSIIWLDGLGEKRSR